MPDRLVDETDDQQSPVIVSGLEKLVEQDAEHQAQESEICSEMDEMIKTSNLPKESKHVISSNFKEW